uniref:Uncharacterized protein n=1 Tax=Trichinella nativa TaxID=6335 RepID=A0A0V1KJP7_9BILA
MRLNRLADLHRRMNGAVLDKAYLDQHAQENYLLGLPEFSQSSSIL